jgi:hypothetical protein
MMQSMHAGQHAGKKILSFPLEGFGLYSSMLLILAAGFLTFFVTTCLAIFALLVWNLFDPHVLRYAADTYRYVGFPAGVIAMVVAFAIFTTLWIRAKLR